MNTRLRHEPLDWFFALSENATEWFQDMIKVAVVSARINTDLTPNCLYDGVDSDLVHWLESNGVLGHVDKVIDVGIVA